MQELRRARRKRRLIVFCAIITFFVLSLGVFSRLEALAIQGLVVENETSVPTGKIEALVRGELRGAYVLIFAKQAALLYPKRAIRETLTASFPEIGSVAFDMRRGHVLALAVSSRERHALWCGETAERAYSEPDGCYFLDSEGLVFARVDGGSAGMTSFRYYGTFVESPHGTTTPVGARFLASAAFAELETLRTLLKSDLSLEPVALSVVDRDALVRLASGTELYFSRSAPFDAAIENLATLIASRTGTSTAERARALDGLEYVDVRFGNRLYYR